MSQKLTRDEERLKSCIKKSKSKTLSMEVNSSGQAFYFFDDVNQTGWHPATIRDLLRDGEISLVALTAHSWRITWKGQ